MTFPRLAVLRQSAVRYAAMLPSLIAAGCLIASFGPLSKSAVGQEKQKQLKAKDLIGYAVDEVGPEHEDVDRAIRKFATRDFKGAQALLDQARRRDPRLPPTGITMAKLYLLSNQVAMGRAELEKVTLDATNDPEPYFIFGERAVLSGRVTDALLLFQKAAALTAAYKQNEFRLNNFAKRSHVGLATVAERQEDWATAASQLQQWLKLDDTSAVGFQRLGRAQFKTENYRGAYESLLKAQQLDENIPSADVMIARLYEQAENREEAKRFMDRARNDPKSNLNTLLQVARWLMETDQYADARPLMNRVVKENPRSLDAQLFMGIVARIMNDDEVALKHFETAYLLAPQNFDAANQLAMFLITRTDQASRSRALTYAETNARLHNKNPEAGVALGWVYYNLGRTREAENVLNNALRAGRLTADSSYFVAKIFYDRGRNDAAVNLLEKALETNQVFVHRGKAKELLDRIQGKAAKPLAGQ